RPAAVLPRCPRSGPAPVRCTNQPETRTSFVKRSSHCACPCQDSWIFSSALSLTYAVRQIRAPRSFSQPATLLVQLQKFPKQLLVVLHRLYSSRKQPVNRIVQLTRSFARV